MAHAAPQTIFNDLLEQSLLLLKSDAPSELVIRRLKGEAIGLANVDAAGSFELRGHLAAAAGDFDEADAFFEKALRITDDLISTVMRFMVMLSTTDQDAKLLAVFERFRDRIRNDPKAIHCSRDLLGASGWLVTSAGLEQDLVRLGIHDFQRFPGRIAEVLGEYGLAEADLEAPISFAHKFLRKQGARSSTVRSSVVPSDTGSSVVLYEFQVDRTPEDVVALELALYEALEARDFTAERSGALILGVTGNKDMDVDHCKSA